MSLLRQACACCRVSQTLGRSWLLSLQTAEYATSTVVRSEAQSRPSSNSDRNSGNGASSRPPSRSFVKSRPGISPNNPSNSRREAYIQGNQRKSSAEHMMEKKRREGPAQTPKAGFDLESVRPRGPKGGGRGYDTSGSSRQQGRFGQQRREGADGTEDRGERAGTGFGMPRRGGGSQRGGFRGARSNEEGQMTGRVYDQDRTSRRGAHDAEVPLRSIPSRSTSAEVDATVDDDPDYTPSSSRNRGAPSRGPPGRGPKEGEERTSQSYSARTESGGEFYISRDQGRGRTREKGKDKDREAMNVDRIRNERSRKTKDVEVKVKVEKKVFVPSSVSVGRLADIFDVKIFNLQRTMQRLGFGEDQRRSDYLLTSEEACNVALEYGLDPTVDDERTFDIFPEPDVEGVKHPLRPPVVTIMGHVDHGKTTLLDSLRHSSVATGEAGGITQHIGAFSVPLSSLFPSAPAPSADSPGSITFLDTPGHAAFTAMRARGASVTDMIVLVVAADDGVMPQTKEVIELWKADQDKVGLVVAINKCDKAGIDYDKVKSALGAEGILLEEDGGDIPSVKVSGLKGIGLDKLVETLSTLAEIRELQARKEGRAEGYILESRVDRGQGNVATILVSKGTLTAGTCIVAGTTWARVRQMQDSAGRAIRSAPPGTPVSIMGWRELPHAGDQLLAAGSEEEAKKAISNRLREIERKKLLMDVESINSKRVAERKRAEKEEEGLEKLKEAGKTEAEIQSWKRELERAQSGGTASIEGEEGKKELRLVIKGDVSGSVEAVVGSLEGIGNKEAGVRIVHAGVGEVGESDIQMAEAAGASIIAFSVPTPRSIQTHARTANVPLHSDTVIYRLIETVRSEVVKLLPPVFETRVTGEAVCQQVFEIKLKGKEVMRVAGCKVGNGSIEMKEGVGIRVLRGEDRTQVHEGTIETLKHLKKDVTEVRKGTECGISFHGFTDVREGDEIIAFTKFEVPRHL